MPTTNATTAATALLMTPRQTAEALAISPRKLWGMTASGEIPHVRIGRSVRYSVDAVRFWLEAKATPVTNPQCGGRADVSQ